MSDRYGDYISLHDLLQRQAAENNEPFLRHRWATGCETCVWDSHLDTLPAAMVVLAACGATRYVAPDDEGWAPSATMFSRSLEQDATNRALGWEL